MNFHCSDCSHIYDIVDVGVLLKHKYRLIHSDQNWANRFRRALLQLARTLATNPAEAVQDENAPAA